MYALSFVGLALFAYFQVHALPPDYATDKILPYFVSLTFPAGIVGLVIASIMAASLSSVDSAINSCTSVVIVDFYHRLVVGRAPTKGDAVDQRRQVQISRIGTFVFGAAGTILATNVSRIGSLLEIANKLINAFAGPLFGIYLLAMFSRRTTGTPALAAGIIGTVTSYVVAYHTSIGFMWPSTFGLAATLIAGAVLTLGSSVSASPAAQKLTWWAVTTEPSPLG
jgi:Na+/proline symporter